MASIGKSTNGLNPLPTYNMLKFVHLFLLVILSNLLFAQDSDIDMAAEYLKNQEWQSAIDIYQSSIEANQYSGEMHYNMGVAYAELGQIGLAIWHFELAKKSGLNNEALEHNMQLVKEKRIDEIEVIPAFFLSKWWNSWRNLLSSNIWSILALLFLLAWINGLYKWKTAAIRTRRKQGFVIGIVAVALAFLFFISSWSASNQFISPNNGVLLSHTSNLRAAPDPESAAIMEIHSGIELQLQDEIGEWVKVRLANGQVGWIPLVEVGLF